jgi:hypothetical protein
MENTRHILDTPLTPTDHLPWHKPVLQRLEINTETRLRGGSTDDGDSLGLVSGDASN